MDDVVIASNEAEARVDQDLAEHEGHFEVDYLEHGPEAWRLAIVRAG